MINNNLELVLNMDKFFCVIVATVPEYYEYKKEHPEHDVKQLEWFQEQEKKGILLCCGPFYPHDGTGLWVIKASSQEAALEIVNSSPRAVDGMLAESARVVEWQVHIGKARLLD